jgi:RNA polymerase sigma-54 factor
MDIGQRLNTRLETKFALSQALQKSLEILRLPQAELALLIHQEIEKNPLLELDSFPSGSFIHPVPETAAVPSLRDHLLSQIREAFDSPRIQKVAEEMIGYLDEKGFFTEPLEKLTILFDLPILHLEKLLATLQTFDPPGIFSRHLQEAFLIQLEREDQKDSLSYRLIEQSFDDFLHGRYNAMKKKLHATVAELREAIQKLARLSTRPASKFQLHSAQPIHPDLKIFRVDQQWFVEAINDLLPKFHIKEEYLNLPELRSFSTSAKWLLRSVARRKNLLLSIGTHLVRKQTLFLSSKGPLIPISSVELSLLFGVHESTISRAISDKYIESPCGLLPLRSLISSPNDPAKELLQRLILSEDKRFPLTDEQIAKKMKKAGCDIARRTIAKYRKQLEIASAAARKHLG